jgi:hypothetical protein
VYNAWNQIIEKLNKENTYHRQFKSAYYSIWQIRDIENRIGIQHVFEKKNKQKTCHIRLPIMWQAFIEGKRYNLFQKISNKRFKR